MADVKFVLFDLEGKTFSPDKILSYEIQSDQNAPCDSIRIEFICEDPLDELCQMSAFADGKCIFKGYVDTQRETLGKDGCRCFLYARSSACLLTDCEANPCTYFSPEAKSLFCIYAADKGFSCDLPDIFGDIHYQVSKGTSCYGAINNFVYGITGQNIVITPDDVVSIQSEGKAIEISPESVISEKRIINRGNALFGIDYKISADTDYKYHRKSLFMQNKKIKSKKVKNLSGKTNYQVEYILHNEMEASNFDYINYKIETNGYCDADCGDVVINYSGELGKFPKGVVSAVTHILDKNGERSIIKLNIPIELEEMSYVDE